MARHLELIKQHFGETRHGGVAWTNLAGHTVEDCCQPAARVSCTEAGPKLLTLRIGSWTLNLSDALQQVHGWPNLEALKLIRSSCT